MPRKNTFPAFRHQAICIYDYVFSCFLTYKRDYFNGEFTWNMWLVCFMVFHGILFHRISFRITNKLSWNIHVDTPCKKARKIIGFIHRAFHSAPVKGTLIQRSHGDRRPQFSSNPRLFACLHPYCMCQLKSENLKSAPPPNELQFDFDSLYTTYGKCSFIAAVFLCV